MLSKINFYQLDNLINNRVPFIFLNMSQSLLDWYDPLGRMHLNIYEILLTKDQVFTVLNEKNAPKNSAIVLLCNDGVLSSKLYEELSNLAYTNVYVVDGGYQQIVTERAQI